MKKELLFRMFALIAAATLFGSCNKNDEPLPDDPETPVEGAKLTLTATGDNIAKTRAAVKYGESVEGVEDFIWELNDVVSLSLKASSGTMYGFRFKVTSISADGNTATLEQYDDVQDYSAPTLPDGNYEVYATYPSDIMLVNGENETVVNGSLLNIDDSGIATWGTGSIPANGVSQPAAAVNLKDDTNKKAWMYMYAQQPSVTISGNSANISLQFKHYTTLLRYTVTNSTGSDFTVTSIDLTTTASDNTMNAFGTSFSVSTNGDAGVLNIDNTTKTSNTVLTSGYTLSNTAVVDFYLPVITSGSLASNDIDKLTLKMISSGDTPSIDISADAFGSDAFKASHCYAIDVTVMGNSTEGYILKRSSEIETVRLGQPGWIPVPNGALNNKLTDGITDDGDDEYDWLHFQTYNLGANSSLTIKQQMASTAYGNTDADVYGGLYQWGRNVNVRNAATSPTNSTKLTMDNYQTSPDLIVTPSPGPYIWYDTDFTNPHKLWGDNPLGDSEDNVSAQTAAPGAPGNNPPSSGLRVPSQYEWSLLCHNAEYDTDNTDDPFQAGNKDDDKFTHSTSGVIPLGNPNIKIFPVVDGIISDSFAANHMCGFVIYSVSTAGVSDINEGTNVAASIAPEPLLFLPCAGRRSYTNGMMWTVGQNGNYWSSTVLNADKAWRMYIGVDSGGVNANDGYQRTDGRSVRCLTE